jgi:hypothetical protein
MADKATRRDFLRATGGLIAGVIISDSVFANTDSNHLETQMSLGERKLISYPSQLTPEMRMKMAQECRRFTQLSRWMTENSEDIFKTAPRKAQYAVGVYPDEGKVPKVYYFKDKYGKHGALDFRIEQSDKGKTTDWRYKDKGDYVYML